MDTGKILHTLIHNLGFFHMHLTADRDEFIDIKYENIMPTALVKEPILSFANNIFCFSTSDFVNFESTVPTYGTSYDYESITHYPANAFSLNGKPTIVAKNTTGAAMMVRNNDSLDLSVEPHF